MEAIPVIILVAFTGTLFAVLGLATERWGPASPPSIDDRHSS